MTLHKTAVTRAPALDFGALTLGAPVSGSETVEAHIVRAVSGRVRVVAAKIARLGLALGPAVLHTSIINLT